MDLLDEKVQALTSSFLQSDVPKRIPLVLGLCFGSRRDPHGRAGLTSCVPLVAAWGAVPGQLLGEGSLLHREKLLWKEFKYWEAPRLELVHTPEWPGIHKGLWGSVLLILVEKAENMDQKLFWAVVKSHNRSLLPPTVFFSDQGTESVILS